MSRIAPIIAGLALVALVLSPACSGGAANPASQPAGVPTSGAPQNAELILATTTSTQDSGLLDVLIPMFEKQTGYKVKPIAVGSGQAMTMGERGEADVLLVHAPDSEKKFMAAGHGTERKLVMHNDFVIVGPADDPAGIKNQGSALDALKKIAESKNLFISRGDNSGTHQLELKLWKLAGIEPRGQTWYQETGQGMGASLGVAAEKSAYTITDRGTYLALKRTLNLEILIEGDKNLLNIYHVITVNPNKSSQINAAGAKAFMDFMTSPETQQVIGKFGVDRFGQPLFFPDAGKTDEEVGD